MVILKEIRLDTNDNCGGEDFHLEKTKQVLHYIISKTGSISTVGKTVLFKLMYFNDFNFYEMFERKMTGESYRKIGHGPAPCHFDQVVTILETEKKVQEIDREIGNYKQKKYVSTCDPDISLLTGEEIHSIDQTIARYSELNATQISAFSHKDVPYAATEDKGIIDYELVFYRDPMFSVREYDDGEDC